MSPSPRQFTAGLGAAMLAAGLSACGETASTGNFKGESRNVAQTVANFQSDASANDQKKLCGNDLAGVITAHLQRTRGCQETVKEQLHEIDSLNMKIESIAVSGSSASARVKSTYSGKNRLMTLKLVKEGSHWKISGLAQR